MAKPFYQRIPSQIGAGLVEGLGLPATVAESLLSLGNRGIESVTGKNDLLPKRVSFNPAYALPGGGLAQLLTGQEAPRLTPPTMQELRENVTEPFFGKEALEPQNFLERVIKSGSQQVPLAVATGGLSAVAPAALGRLGAGTAAALGSKELGLPAPVQFFAGIAGEKGFDKLLSRVTKTGIPRSTLGSMAKEAKTQFYAKEKELGSKIKLKAEPYRQNLARIEKQVENDTKLSDIEQKQLLRDIDQYKSDFIGKSKVSASDLVKRRGELNYNIYNSNDIASNYYEALINPLRDAINTEGKAHPEWYKNLKSGDALHDALNFRQSFTKGLKDYPKIQKALQSPLAYSAAIAGPTFYFTRDPLTTLATAVATGATAYGAGKGLDLAGFLRQGAPQQLLLKASEEMIKRNYPAALRTYTQLDNAAKKYEKEQKQNMNPITKRLVPDGGASQKKQPSMNKVTSRLIPD